MINKHLLKSIYNPTIQRISMTVLITLLLALSTLFELVPYIKDSEDDKKDKQGKISISYSYARMVCFIILTLTVFLPFWWKKRFGNISVTHIEMVFGVLSIYYIIFYALLIAYH